MPEYAYRMRDKQGEVQKGKIQAESTNDAVALVRKMGGTPIEVRESRAQSSLQLPKLKRLSLKDKIVFTEQLAVMLKAGITLVQALKGLADESSNGYLREILTKLVADVEGGAQFSEALSHHPKVFSRIYCQMVASSEKSGNLADILGQLTVQQQKEYDLKGKVKGALMYPAIISVLLLSVIVMVITFILPRLTGLFADSGVDLPATTRFLIALSDIFVNQWFIPLGIVASVIIGLKVTGNNPRGRYFLDKAKMKVPVLGAFLQKSYMARFCQSFASLSAAGVPVLEIFQTLRGVVGNTVIEKEIETIAADVENGIKVSTAIRKSKYFPGMVGQLVSVGEQSGDLAGVFKVLGEFFEKEVDGMAKNLSTLLEPIIMIVMGVGVAFVLISVLQPIFDLSSSI